MDSKLYRLPTKPNLYAASMSSHPMQPNGFQTAPTEDLRYPGWAAPAEDGRLFTDYRFKCETNIPVEKQEKSRIWMQRNAEKIILVSRERQASSAGMKYPYDPSVVPPAEMISDCRKFGCTLTETGKEHGVGMVRANTPAPDLFGTFEVPKTLFGAPKPNIQITTKYEGGRNTPRN
jgi:hypothetical protein